MKIIPTAIKTWLRTKVQEAALGGVDLPVTAMKYRPYEKESGSYVIPKVSSQIQEICNSGLPGPPAELWLGYGDTIEEYLASGERHVARMLEILRHSGFPVSNIKRVLDFGCGGGRMIRQLKELSTTCEIWGTDIDARSIYWCKQYLEPPFHFFTTTTIPHLPFRDDYFDLIYAGSVFTHIDDLAEAWLLELRRVLSAQGRIYLTIHDNHTMALLDADYNHTWLSKELGSSDFYNEARKIGGKIVIGRDSNSQVFYDIDYFTDMVDPIFDIISMTPQAYDYQTGILLRHKSREGGQADRG